MRIRCRVFPFGREISSPRPILPIQNMNSSTPIGTRQEVTSITATRRGEYDLALGNVIGSNIFNIGVVLGIPVALFGDISHLNFNYVDIGVMLLVAFLLFIFATNNRQITKREGMVFLGVFFVYYGYLLCLG